MAHVAARAAETSMEHPGFFERAGPFALGAVAAAANAKLADGVDPDLALKDVRPLDEAGEGDLSFVDNPKYLPAFATTGASACLVAPKFANQAPASHGMPCDAGALPSLRAGSSPVLPGRPETEGRGRRRLTGASDRQARARRDC